MSRLLVAVLASLTLAATALPASAATVGGGVSQESPLATHGRFGLGLGGGTLTSGISGKLYLDGRNAIQAVVGTYGGYFANSFGWSAGVDYLREMANLASGSVGTLHWNVGAGVGAIRYDNSLVGSSGVFSVSGVVGIGFDFRDFPVEIALEWRPSYLTGDYLGGLALGDTGSHLRWYF